MVMVPSGACGLDAAPLSPLARIYMHDWDEKADGPPPPLPEGCLLPTPDGGKPWRCPHHLRLVVPNTSARPSYINHTRTPPSQTSSLCQKFVSGFANTCFPSLSM